MALLSGKRPVNLGLKNGKLAPSPSTPNCVSSHSSGKHFIEPMYFNTTAKETWNKLNQIVEEHKGAKVIQRNDHYLYAEFSTALLGFVDDVEFYLSEQENCIHARSASRLGYSDMGKNRQRIENIRSALLGFT